MSSYQVFARKYRPQTFDQVVGQEHIVQTLRNAIATNRLAHAYLFVGPRGTGKTSTARILAKALNCVNGPTINPCGECVVCREIATGSSLDVLEIDGASNNSVEQVRELRENVRFAPTRGKYKVYIIDEVHMLTTAAFNALLKTLEEPPEHVKFIFATTDVQKVLPTILSRCQRFDLRRIPAELIAGHLSYIAENEKIRLYPEAARAIAKGAEGGLRDAESMLDQLVAFCGEEITEQDVLSVFGFTASHTIATLCDALLVGDSAAALGMVQQQAEAGRDLSRLMSDLIGHLRNVLVAKADPEGIKAEVGDEALTILQEQAEMLTLERLLDLIEQFAEAENRMKWAPNKKLHFEIAVIKAIQTLNQATLTEVLDSLTAIRTGKEPPAPPVRPKRTLTPRAPMAAAPVRQAAPKPVAPASPSPAPEPSPEPAAPEPPKAAEPASVVDPAPAPEPEIRAETPAPAVPEPVATMAPVSEEEVPPWEERPVAAAPAAAAPAPATPPAEPVVDASPALVEAKEEAKAEVPEEPKQQPEMVNLHELWCKVAALVRERKALIFPAVEAGRLVEVNKTTYRIAFPREKEFQKASLERPTNRKLLEELFFTVTKQSVTLVFETRENLELTPLDLPEKETPVAVDPMEEFKNDPLIRKALELFQAEIQTS